MQEDLFPRAFFYGFGLIAVLLTIVRLFPRSRLVRELLSRQGPSLDLTGLTRSQCLREALLFLLMGALAFTAAMIVSVVAARWCARPWDEPSFTVLMLTLVLFTMMGVAGALYLLVRALFRRRSSEEDDHAGA